MAASLIGVREAAGMSPPHILFWGHEPRPLSGRTGSERAGAHLDNTAAAQEPGWPVPDAPFVWRRSALGDHGIVSGYRAYAGGQVESVLLWPRNDAGQAWSANSPVLRRRTGAFGSTAWRLWSCRFGRRPDPSMSLAVISRFYCAVAALNLTTSSAGTRPRSFTSMPWALAHSRTSVVFSPVAVARRPLRAGRRAAPLARRAAPT